MPYVLQLSNDDRDQLGELLNIGVAHAGTTLSQMTGRRIAISVPSTSLKNTKNASDFLEKPDEITLAVLLRLSGGLDGYVFLLLSRDVVIQLLHMLSGKNVRDLRELDPYDRSIFQEVGNVLTGGMLQGFSSFLHIPLLHSVPDVVIDMGGAMFNSLAATMIAHHEEFLSLDVNICIDPSSSAVDCKSGEETTGRMFLFLGPEAVKDILALTHPMVS
jgi:chemotaxis protein CheY-P-specific phosphatase CheC